jgi:hypothetical protein
MVLLVCVLPSFAIDIPKNNYPKPDEYVIIKAYTYINPIKNPTKDKLYLATQKSLKSILSKEAKAYLLTKAYTDALEKIKNIDYSLIVPQVYIDIERDIKNDSVVIKEYSYPNSRGTLSWTQERAKRSSLSKEEQAYILTEAYKNSLKFQFDSRYKYTPRTTIDIKRDMKLLGVIVPKLIPLSREELIKEYKRRLR